MFFGYAAHPSAGIIRIRSFGSDCASLSALRLPVISIGNRTTMEGKFPSLVNPKSRGTNWEKTLKTLKLIVVSDFLCNKIIKHFIWFQIVQMMPCAPPTSRTSRLTEKYWKHFCIGPTSLMHRFTKGSKAVVLQSR